MKHRSNAAGLFLWPRTCCAVGLHHGGSDLHRALRRVPADAVDLCAGAVKMVGVNDTGLLFGFAQPDRSDEWALWTPYVQIAVNNGFARIEHISPYEADLRNFNALPLWDWGLYLQAADVGVLCAASRGRLLADVRDPTRRMLDRLVSAGARTALHGLRGGNLLAQHVRATLCATLVDDDRSTRCPFPLADARLHRTDAALPAPTAARLDHRHVPAVAFLHDLHFRRSHSQAPITLFALRPDVLHGSAHRRMPRRGCDRFRSRGALSVGPVRDHGQHGLPRTSR